MKESTIQLILLLRPKHWLKNSFIFLPAFFAGRVDLMLSVDLIYTFISFCFVASSVYVLNDILDIELDRLHPVKKNRPLASGRITKKSAFILFSTMLLLVFGSFFLIHEAHLYVVLYFVLNLLYSFKLKYISIIDVSCISLGFVLRILAGGAEAGVYVSHWMIIMVFLLTVSIAFAKRRFDIELIPRGNTSRQIWKGFTTQFLDMATTLSLTITLIAYIMYSLSAEVIRRIGSDWLFITSFFVFIGVIRYIQIMMVDKNTGSPIDVLLTDRMLQVVLFLWMLTFSIIIYG